MPLVSFPFSTYRASRWVSNTCDDCLHIFVSEVKPTQYTLLESMPLAGDHSRDLSACRNNEASVDCSVVETNLYEHPESRVTCEA